MRKSAGLLLYRKTGETFEVLLVHPGGPYWKDRDEGAWTIPKGEYGNDESPLEAAKREFEEETGMRPEGTFLPLQPVRQKGGKFVTAWALEGSFDPDTLRSNTYRQEWPYKSGKWQSFPEVDAAAWFSPTLAALKINPAQYSFIEQLAQLLSSGGEPV